MSTKRKAESHSKGASRPRIMKPAGSRADSERDSGFSDASSEHMSTMHAADMEDSGVQQRPRSAGSGQQLAVVGGSYSGLSPMIIMNNVLLKQPGDPPPALKPWSFSPTMEVVQPVVQHPQVVFLQPVVSRQASPASKEATPRHRRPKKYLPILKSYPKIAPHPGDSSSSSGRGTASSSSSSSGSERGSLTPNNRDHYRREKLQRSASTSGSTTPSLPGTPSCMSPQPHNQLSLPATDPSCCSSSSSSPARERPPSSVSQTELTPSLSFTHTAGSNKQKLPAPWTVAQDDASSGQSDPCDGDGDGDDDGDSKRKRFCNTYNILSKSGLLDITLRTKELLRQNRRTQSDLERLKENTDLFLQALRSGDSSICLKLQASLQEEDREKERERERAVQTCVKAD